MSSSPMNEALRTHAESAIGFMPADEGLALHTAARDAAARVPGAPLLEIGSYCGKSTIYLAAAAREAGTVLFAVDHHRGSEEHQPGWEYHDESLVDPHTGLLDTLATFRRTITDAGLEDVVVAVVARSATLGSHWNTPLALAFIDGSHTEESAASDYASWSPHVAPDGVLAIHDVYPSSATHGQAPYEIYRRALASGSFEDLRTEGSLRILRRASA